MCALVLFASSTAAADVTFNRDIAPILWRQCASCHRPGQFAPFSLVDYKDVVPRARQIVAVTKSRVMPPWLPDSSSAPFANDRRLSQQEIDAIAAWVDGGTKQGAPADLPPRPAWTDVWHLGTPDLVVELPQPYTLPPGRTDAFRTFVLPIPVSSARYVRGLEVRPGNRQVVHHVTIALDRSRASRRLDEADPGPGFGGGMFSPDAHNPENRALGWTPGSTPAMEPDGMAWRLEPNTDLVMQFHMLPPQSGAAEVRPSVGFYFTNRAPTRPTIDFKLGSKAIDIPAGQSNYAIEDSFVLPVGVEVMSVYPHAHYLAKEMTATATLPDGSSKTLVHIAQWDFHWQDEYRYTSPVALPAGSVLSMKYTYDNSAANKRNPQKPPVRVAFGPQSSDEMGDLWLRLLPRDASGAVQLARAYRDRELGKDIALGERRVAEQPRDGKLRSALAVSYVEAGSLDRARSELEEAIRLAPALADAHNNLGHVLQLQNNVTAALPHFREAARLSPDNDLVHLNLGNALEDTGELDEAIVHLRRAIALNPASADAHNSLGIALGSKGLMIEAEREFRRALEIQPDHPDAAKNLQMVLELRK